MRLQRCINDENTCCAKSRKTCYACEALAPIPIVVFQTALSTLRQNEPKSITTAKETHVQCPRGVVSLRSKADRSRVFRRYVCFVSKLLQRLSFPGPSCIPVALINNAHEKVSMTVIVRPTYGTIQKQVSPLFCRNGEELLCILQRSC